MTDVFTMPVSSLNDAVLNFTTKNWELEVSVQNLFNVNGKRPTSVLKAFCTMNQNLF